jgi:hypothetical protein
LPVSASNGTINTLQEFGVVTPLEPANSLTGSGIFSGGFNNGTGFLQTGSSRGSNFEGSPTPFEPTANTRADVTFSARYTNTLASAQDFSLTLDLPQFFASLGSNTQDEAVASSVNFRFELFSNANTLFDLMFSATKDAENNLTSLIFTRNGTSLLSNDPDTFDVCNRNPVLECALRAFSTTLSLGTFNPGEFADILVRVNGTTSIGLDANGFATPSASGPSSSVSLGGFNERFNIAVNATPAAAQPVNAPASLALFGAGLAGLAMLRRRRRAA